MSNAVRADSHNVGEQQRLLFFLRDGYFGRLIYQWSRCCSNDFITCKEFLLFFLTVSTTCLGQGASFLPASGPASHGDRHCGVMGEVVRTTDFFLH